MRLTPSKVDDLARQMLRALAECSGAEILDEKKAAAVLRQVFLDDLKAEDDLDEQVRALLRRHASQIHGENLDYELLFQRAKKQLAREKGIVL